MYLEKSSYSYLLMKKNVFTNFVIPSSVLFYIYSSFKLLSAVTLALLHNHNTIQTV